MECETELRTVTLDGVAILTMPASKTDDALKSWLPKSLRLFEIDGRPLFTGAKAFLEFREPTAAESDLWHSSRQRAHDLSEDDGGHEGWLCLHVPVTAPLPRPTRH
jgi:hypothetical protein